MSHSSRRRASDALLSLSLPKFAALTALLFAVILMVGDSAAAVSDMGRTRTRELTPASDRDALVALYHATDGANWVKSANWLSDRPLGEWHGVTTDSAGRVTSLDLSGNRLSGKIPPELGNLANLTGLYLSDNQLRGMIPSELSNLANLSLLHLSANQLSGRIPSELGKHTNLRQMSLDSNRLRGEIPSELGNLTKLEGLSLTDNRLNGTIPAELGNLTNLEELNLADNQLSGCLPAVLRNAANDGLGDLALPYCDTLISASEKRAALIVLYGATNGANWTNRTNWLSDSPLGEWHGIATDKAGRIISLDLRENQLSGSIPPEIGNLTDLRGLFLRGQSAERMPAPSLAQCRTQ